MVKVEISVPERYEDQISRFKEHMQAQNLSYNTQKAYLLHIKKFLNIQERTEDTQHAINILLARCKNSPWVARSALKSILEFMRIQYNADISGLNIPRVKGRRVRQIRTCPSNYVKRAVQVLDRLDDKMLVELTYSLALRSSEATHLRITNISFSKQQLTLIGKGNVEATIPITDEDLLARLKSYIKYKVPDYPPTTISKKKDWLFPKIACLKHPDRHFRYIMSLAGKELMEYYNPHSLRHGRATFLHDHNMDLLSLQGFMRHKSLNSTSIYAKPSAEKIRADIQKAELSDN